MGFCIYNNKIDPYEIIITHSGFVIQINNLFQQTVRNK